MASGVSSGKTWREEMLLEPGALGLLEVGAVDQRDAGGGELRRAVRASAAAGRCASRDTASPMRASCSAGVSPSGLRVGDALRAPGP